MRKYIVCFALLLLCCTGSMQGQAVSTQWVDYCGTWQGHDADGNTYKLVLNADYTGVIIINGINSPATLFKVELDNSIPVLGYGTIDLYIPSSTSNQNNITLSPNNEPWQLLQCGIISFDGTQMLLQMDKGVNRPSQFDISLQATLNK